MEHAARHRYRCVYSLLSLLVAVGAAAQSDEESESESESRNEIGVFAGALVNIEAGETSPSIGIDYTRELSSIFGLGIQAEFAKAGGRETLVAGTMVFRPGGDFRLVIAPGVIVERESHESGEGEALAEEPEEGSGRKALWAVRFGVGYQIERPNVVIAPTAFIDFLDGGEDAVDVHVVFGISIGFPY